MSSTPLPQVALAGHLDDTGVSGLRPFTLGASTGRPAPPARRQAQPRQGDARRGWHWLSLLLCAAALVMLWQQLTTPAPEAVADTPAGEFKTRAATPRGTDAALSGQTRAAGAEPARPGASVAPGTRQAAAKGERPADAPLERRAQATRTPRPATPASAETHQQEDPSEASTHAAPDLETLRRLQRNM